MSTGSRATRSTPNKLQRRGAKEVQEEEFVRVVIQAHDRAAGQFYGRGIGSKWQVLSAAEQLYHDRVYFDLELQRTTHHEALCVALESIEPTAVTLDPPWCRITDWTWNLTPLSSAGSVKGIGQRFNIGVDLDRARGQAFPCLYLAQDEKTAQLEKFGPLEHGSGGTLSTYDFALRTPESFVTFALTGHVDAVLDVRSHGPLNAFAKIIQRFSISAETKRFA